MSDQEITSSSCTVGADKTTVDNKTLGSAQRRLLMGGSLTGVAAVMWHKPLINTIVLPAHAQTSVVATALTFFGGGTATPKGVSSSLLNLLVPDAHATVRPVVETVMAFIVQNEVEGTDYTVSVLIDLGKSYSDKFEKTQLVFSGSLTLGAAAMLAVSEDPCDLANTVLGGSSVPPLSLTLNSVSEELAEISYSSELFDAGDVRIPAGSGALPMAMCVDVPLPKAFASFDFNGPDPQAMMINNSFEGLAQSVLNTIVPTATAGSQISFLYSATVVLTNAATNTYFVSVQSEGGGIRWSGSASSQGSSQDSKIDVRETIGREDIPSCRELNPSSIQVGIGLPSTGSMNLVISVEGFRAFTVLTPSDNALAVPGDCQR